MRLPLVLAAVLAAVVLAAGGAGGASYPSKAATNPQTCPLWSKLAEDGSLSGKSPQLITVSRRQLTQTATASEWEVTGTAMKPGIVLYSGVVQVLIDRPPFGLTAVTYRWMHHRGRALTVRVQLTAGQVFRSTVCGRGRPRHRSPSGHDNAPAHSDYPTGWNEKHRSRSGPTASRLAGQAGLTAVLCGASRPGATG